MTIVIGIKFKDGVVIACDSQVGFSRGVAVKRLNANKIYRWDDKFALAGSGVMAQIQTVAESIEIATYSGFSYGKVAYHVKQLEKAGILKVVDKKKKGGRGRPKKVWKMIRSCLRS